MHDLTFLSLLLFVAAGFAASMITGLAGFAFGIIVAGPWMHVLAPSQTTSLIVAYGLLIQGYSVWKLRAAIKFGRLLPFPDWQRDWRPAWCSLAELGHGRPSARRCWHGADRLRPLRPVRSEPTEVRQCRQSG